MDFKEISKTRGKARADKIKKVSLSFYNALKKNSIPYFEVKELIDEHDGLKVTKTARYKIVKSILNFLESKGKVKKDKKEIRIKRFQNLANGLEGSNDFGSFEVLMKKSGFKRNVVLKDEDEDVIMDWVNLLEIDTDNDINDADGEFIDEPTLLWNSGQKNGCGCRSYGNKSLRLVSDKRFIDIYSII